MEAGTLVKWLVKPGDRVRRGDLVAVVQTEKADVEVEIFSSGVVEKLCVSEGEKVPVGAVLATLGVEGEAPPAAPAAARAPAVPTGPAVPRSRVSPAAQRRARELAVDLSRIPGTGPEGSVTLQDVERTAAAAKPPDRQAAMRAGIAAAMSRSKREIPHYYLGTRIDMGRTLDWLEAGNRTRSVERRILPSILLLKAVALALRKVPELNGFWRDGAFQPSAAVHVGVAISLRAGGLVAPAVHDMDRKSLDELMDLLRDLVTRARAGSLRSSEMSDPTVTVTNLGDLGVETVYGVIFPPQVALVGFGRITETPWANGGAVTARPVVTATLSADHRASDGHRGGLFLTAVCELLQRPEEL